MPDTNVFLRKKDFNSSCRLLPSSGEKAEPQPIIIIVITITIIIIASNSSSSSNSRINKIRSRRSKNQHIN